MDYPQLGFVIWYNNLIVACNINEIDLVYDKYVISYKVGIFIPYHSFSWYKGLFAFQSKFRYMHVHQSKQHMSIGIK